MEKNGLKKSVKLRKKKRSDWKLLFKSNCVKKAYPFESVQKAFEKRSKSVRNRSTLRKMLRKMKDFSRSKQTMPSPKSPGPLWENLIQNIDPFQIYYPQLTCWKRF